jgi:hypothetical protein
MDEWILRSEDAGQRLEKSLLPLSRLAEQTIRLEQDNTILGFVRRERSERNRKKWLKKPCKYAEKEAKSRCEFTESELSKLITRANRIYAPPVVRETMKQARSRARSAAGVATMANDVALIVEDLFDEHSSERSVPATSGKSKSWEKLKSFGKK